MKLGARTILVMSFKGLNLNIVYQSRVDSAKHWKGNGVNNKNS